MLRVAASTNEMSGSLFSLKGVGTTTNYVLASIGNKLAFKYPPATALDIACSSPGSAM